MCLTLSSAPFSFRIPLRIVGVIRARRTTLQLIANGGRRAVYLRGSGAPGVAVSFAVFNDGTIFVGQVLHFASFFGLGKGHYHTCPSLPALFGFIVECAPQPSPTSLFCVPQNKDAGEGVKMTGYNTGGGRNAGQ